ncbi:MAG: HAD family phosphatase [Bacteroidota bacterium]
MIDGQSLTVKAVLLDFDGTLVNSENVHFLSWKEILEDFGIEMRSSDYLEKYAGTPTPQNAKKLIQKFRMSVSETELINRKNHHTHNYVQKNGLEFMPFALQLLTILQNEKVPISLVTGSSRAEVEPVLQRAGLLENFEHIITRNDVTKSKPDPECYLKCVRLMKFSPKEYVALEDSKGGVRAAKGAGLKCYGVQSDRNLRSQLGIEGADNTFKDLKEAYEVLRKDLSV